MISTQQRESAELRQIGDTAYEVVRGADGKLEFLTLHLAKITPSGQSYHYREQSTGEIWKYRKNRQPHTTKKLAAQSAQRGVLSSHVVSWMQALPSAREEMRLIKLILEIQDLLESEQ